MRAINYGCLFVLLFGCSPEPADDARLPLKSQGRLKGQVVAPLEGTCLYVYKLGADLAGSPFAISSPTSADGIFTLELPDGEYLAVVRDQNNGASVPPLSAKNDRSEIRKVTVKGSEVKLTLVVSGDNSEFKGVSGVLPASKTGVSGQIFDSDGKPAEGIRVHVYDHVQMSERPKFISEKTGPDGRYLINLPAGGTYYIAARDKFGGPPKLGDFYGRYDQGTIEPAAVVVREGETSKDINITVSKVW